MPEITRDLPARVSHAKAVDLCADTLTDAMAQAARWVASHDDDVLTVLAMRVDYYREPDAHPVTVTIIYQGCERPCCTGWGVGS